jgi:hypothetical protein
MIFHVSYEIPMEHRDAAQTRLKETGGLPPEGIQMLGRWHLAGGRKGIVIAETSDAVAIAKWLQDWTDILSFEVTPALDDEQLISVIS